MNSRNNNVPVKQDENDTILVSGSSASTFNMVISENINPYDYMLSVINKPRYKDLVEKIITDSFASI